MNIRIPFLDTDVSIMVMRFVALQNLFANII